MRHSTASRCTDLQNKSTVSGRNLSRNYNKSQLSLQWHTSNALSVAHGKMASKPPSRLREKAEFSPVRVIKMYCFVLAGYKLYYSLVYAYLNDAIGRGDLRTGDRLNEEIV